MQQPGCFYDFGCGHCGILPQFRQSKVDEFTFRLNAGKVSRYTTERLDSFVDAIAGKRITYAQLTKGKTWFDAEELV
jgi:hypothetical protein